MISSWFKPLLPLSIVAAVLALVASAARNPLRRDLPAIPAITEADSATTLQVADRILSRIWNAAGVDPAEPADELTILRRLSLALHGTIPSLEEIRLFEADREPGRLERWTRRLLDDRRFADYFAARLSRVFVGADDGQFILFRRDRFNAWLADQLHANRPYDQIVRDVLSQQGLWTGSPATNFVTAAVADDNLDRNELAGRTVRAFLGQRIDCAQCHDHPFAPWKQSQFEGLAACFGQVQISPVGIEDNPRLTYEVEDRTTLAKRTVAPAVPFHPEWLPPQGTLRERLAAWVTHPENRRFERAAVNRVWGLLFGRPWIEPVDDLPDPPENEERNAEGDKADIDSAPANWPIAGGEDHPSSSDLLDVLGRDFRAHHCDLKRLIGLIAAMQVFRLSSEHPAWNSGDNADTVDKHWAAFPLTRLRPEQVIGSMSQAASLKTADRNSHLLFRTIRLFREIDFVRDYGDLGDDELTDRAGTIPQALLRMNGRFSCEMSEPNLVNAAGRISAMAPGTEPCIELCFLVCLTRRPTAEELAALAPSFENIPDNQRSEVVEDLYWALFNAPEFSWNH
jgi:hypothetical protein